MIRRWLREPLLQFLLIGLALFVVYEARDRNAGPRERPDRIELTADDVRQIGLAWAAQGRATPSPEEMRSLIDARVREEILYREALALGLDRNDTIVKRRLAQKLEFLVEDVAALRQPTDGELRAWFARNAGRFTLPARATFGHLYFSPDRRGPRTRDDAARALERLDGRPADAPEATALADPFVFQDYYGDRTPDDVARTFGPAFARALFGLEAGAWQGPIESGYGWHLVWVDSMTPARVPVFEDVAPAVETTWTEDQRAEIRRTAFEAMRARYEVLPTEPTADDRAIGGDRAAHDERGVAPAATLAPLAGMAPSAMAPR